MSQSKQLSISLPVELADLVKAKVATGEYASESDVIHDGLRSLLARDQAMEDWLRQEVGPAFDAMAADPSRAVSIEYVRAMLKDEHERLTAK